MKSVYLCFIILCMFSILSADPFFEFEPEIVDAASAAMGRTSVLSTSVSNALFTNPANLCNVNELTFQAGGRILSGSEAYEFHNDNYEDIHRMYPSHEKLNHFSLALPVRLSSMPVKPIIAVGYRTYYDFGYNYERDDVSRSNTDFEGIEYNYHGGLNTLTLGGALNYRDLLFLGAAYNKGVFGNVTENIGVYQSYDEYEFEGTIDGSFANFGLVYKDKSKLQVGLYYRPGFTIDLDGDFYNLFYGVEDHIDIPPLLALGAAVQLSNDSFLTLEYQTRKFDEYKEGEQNYYWTDTEPGQCIRMGGSIGKAISVRMGIFIDSIPSYDIDVNGNVSDTPNLNVGFTGGLGFFRDGPNNLDIYGELAFTETAYDYYGYTYSGFLIKLGATYTYRFISRK